jgi:hypothetical protein
MACVALHPIVDQLEADLGKRAEVLRVSIFTTTGRKVMTDLNVSAVPTFVVLDGKAKEVWRGESVPSIGQVLQT